MFDTIKSMTDRRRFALREPRSLQPEQLDDLPVSSTITPQNVRAWVVWEDGVEELIDGVAIAWTRRAVRVRFGIPGHMHEAWVWAGAVERSSAAREAQSCPVTGGGDQPGPRSSWSAKAASTRLRSVVKPGSCSCAVAWTTSRSMDQ